jgi:hypothetical protein
VNTDWQTVRLDVQPPLTPTVFPNGDEYVLRVFVDGVQLFPNGDVTRNFTTRARSASRVVFGSSNTSAADSTGFYVDDLFVDGVQAPDTVVPLGPSFADDSPFTIHFFDSLDTYDTTRRGTPQGFADYRAEFLPYDAPGKREDWEAIQLIDDADPLAAGDEVIPYQIITIDRGNPGVEVGDIVAVSAEDLLPTYDPANDIYGVFDFTPPFPEWRLRQPDLFSRSWGIWRLVEEDAFDSFDPATMVDAGLRFEWRKRFRYTGRASETRFVTLVDEGLNPNPNLASGDAMRLRVSSNTDDPAERRDEIEVLDALLPMALPNTEGKAAMLEFSMYVAQSDFETGAWVELDGATASAGRICDLSFGGRGLLDSSGNEIPTGVFAYRTGEFGGADPRSGWISTGVPVPTEQWFRVKMFANTFAEWDIVTDSVPLASGVAIDAGDPDLNTMSIDGFRFVRTQFGDRDGDPTETGGDPPVVILPADEWYIDNIQLESVVGGSLCGVYDLTGNGRINAGDLAVLIGQWGESGTSADFNGDGVGADDLARIIGGWGPCD